MKTLGELAVGDYQVATALPTQWMFPERELVLALCKKTASRHQPRGEDLRNALDTPAPELRCTILCDYEKVISHVCNLLSPQCFVLIKPEQTETSDPFWLRF